MVLDPDPISAISNCVATPNIFQPVIEDAGVVSFTLLSRGASATPLPQGTGYRLTRTVTNLSGVGAMQSAAWLIRKRPVDTEVLGGRTVSATPPIPGIGGIVDSGSLSADGVSGEVRFDLRPADTAGLPGDTLCSYSIAVTDFSGVTQVVEIGSVYVVASS